MKTIGRDFGDVARKVYATASGTLPNGKPVVVNSNGTVSVVSGSDAAGGSASVFENASTDYPAVTFDSNSNKIVIAYQDLGNSNYGTAVVGTLSGTSITFGTPVVYVSASSTWISATFDSNSNKVVIASSNGAIVGTVSGASISFGSMVAFPQGHQATKTSTTFDSITNKVVFAYSNNANNRYGTARIGTVSGTSMVFNSSATVFESAETNNIGCTFDSNSNKVVIGYEDNPNSLAGTAIVGTVDGTNISFGSAVVFQSGTTARVKLAFDTTTNKVVIIYNNSSVGKAIVGTVSGTSISFGSAATFHNADLNANSIVYDSNNQKVVVAFENTAGGDSGVFIVGTVDGTNISFGSATTFVTTNLGTSIGLGFDSNSNKSVVAYPDDGNGSKGTAMVLSLASTTLTAENYIGMSSGGVAFDIAVEALGSETVFDVGSVPNVAAAYDLNANRIVLAYKDAGNGNKGTAIVGTVSGTSISFGSAVVFYSGGDSGEANFITAVYDSNSNKVVIAASAYDGSAEKGTAFVGTVNPANNSISFGTAVVYENGGGASHQTSTFDSNSNKVVIAYRDNSNSAYGTAIVGTVSGTNISFGTPAVFESASATYISCAFDSNSNKVVIAYRDNGNNDYGTSIVGTVSGTNISYGSAVVFNAGRADRNAVVFDSNSNKIVIAFMDGGDSEKGKAIVGTVSGTGISYGSEVVFLDTGSYADYISAVYNSLAQKVIISYRRVIASNSAQSGELISGTVSGTSISFGSATQFNNAGSNYMASAYDSTSSTVVTAYSDAGDSNKGTAIVYQAGFDNTVRGQVASGGAALVNTKGAININQNALTAGQSYFVQTDGTITTTAGTPSVFAGTAVSATKLIVKG